MKILFLDIDGVLNCDRTKERLNCFTGVNQRLLDMFQGWLEGKDLEIVLSSSWRKDPEFVGHLTSLGLSFLDRTPDLPGNTRGTEIYYWLTRNPDLKIDRMAILDDANDLHPFIPYLVKTSPIHGLRDKNLKRLDKLLAYD